MSTVKTDLGIIRIESVGARDAVYLAHNDLLAFTVTCEPDQETRIKISRVFAGYPITQWEQVFAFYVRWKRSQLSGIKLPNHSGMTKTGDTHPWRKMKRAPKTTQDDDENPTLNF